MKKILAAALLAAFASTALAQKKESNAAFDSLDKNRDGFLSRDEAAGEKELAKRFAKFDANKDGRLNQDEFIKANQDNDKRVVRDSTITTKIKAKLLTAKNVKSTAISVETYEGRVQLSGFVDDKAQVTTAGRIAAGVAGAKNVQNDLKVK